MLLTAYLEMFHGSILLNCELCGCKAVEKVTRKSVAVQLPLSTIFQLCWDGSSWDEPVLSKA